MRIPYKRIGVVIGFSLLLAILIVNATVTRRQLSVQVGAESWVSHTHEVLFELNQLELLVADAETGQRGYLYTGDSKYLAPYRHAITKIDPQIDAIARLTADNPRQQAAIPELRDRVHAKVVEMAEVVALTQSGKPEAARELVLTSTELLLMDHIRLVITQMENEETRLETLRETAYETAISQTVASIYLASLLAVIGLVFLAYYILREINLRERHAQELQAREEWFRVTLTSIGDAVIATDNEGAVLFLNPVAETLTGIDLDRAKGKNILEVFPIINEQTHQLAENPVSRVLEVGQVVGLANHTVLVGKDGVQIPIEDSAAPIRGSNGELLGVVLVFRDVSKERKAREAMRRTERLVAAGRLSATIAHEINNPLQAVASLVYLSRTMADVPEAVGLQLSLAEQELQRVAHIAQQTLGFYKEPGATESVDVPAMVESVLALYSNKLKSKGIRIERHYDDRLWVRAAPGELRMAISNLIVNATEAVGTRGTIKITLGSVEEAGHAMLRVLIEDDGTGILPENKQHLFEPFFTTKRDVGTGLGLWLTKEIVERHGGRIEVVVRADEQPGAAFSIILPASRDNGDVPASHAEITTFQARPDGYMNNKDLVEKGE